MFPMFTSMRAKNWITNVSSLFQKKTTTKSTHIIMNTNKNKKRKSRGKMAEHQRWNWVKWNV
jgi:hypothetical protein